MNTVSELGGKSGWPVPFALLVLVLVMLAGFFSPMFLTDSDQTRFQIPGAEFELEHSRQLSAMCEFHRQMTYYAQGEKGPTTPLMYDFAGGYPINCYLIKTPSTVFIRLDDWLGEHLLDLTNQKTYFIVRTPNGKYLNELLSEFPDCHYGTTNNDPSTFRVEVEGKAGIPIAQLTDGLPETYIGCLAGSLGNLKFLPASDIPERKMQHRSEFL